MGSIAKHFNIFLYNIRIPLHVILPLCPLLFTCPIFELSLINHSFLRGALDRYFWNYKTKLTLELWVADYITICVAWTFEPVSFTVAINWKIHLFLFPLIPSNTSLLRPGTMTPRSIIILYTCDKIYNKYNLVAHL